MEQGIERAVARATGEVAMSTAAIPISLKDAIASVTYTRYVLDALTIKGVAQTDLSFDPVEVDRASEAENQASATETCSAEREMA